MMPDKGMLEKPTCRVSSAVEQRFCKPNRSSRSAPIPTIHTLYMGGKACLLEGTHRAVFLSSCPSGERLPLPLYRMELDMDEPALRALKEEDMIERVAKAIGDKLSSGPPDDLLNPLALLATARAAIEAVADHLDCMGTGSDEDMMAVEWITGLLRDAALQSPSGVSHGPPEGGTGEYAFSVRFDASGGKAMFGGGVGKLSSSE